jgi:hypothetical protein
MENKVRLGDFPGVDLSALDAAQRGGHTCIRCGRVPLHRVDRTQVGAPDLFACSGEDAAICSRPVFWLAKPCPRWCNGLHDNRDSGPDRRHFSSWEEQVPLTLEDAQEMGPGLGWQPEHVVVSLDQGVREDAPRIWCGKGVTNQGWHLTEDEASRLAVTLTAAADLAAGEPADQLQLPFDVVAA